MWCLEIEVLIYMYQTQLACGATAIVIFTGTCMLTSTWYCDILEDLLVPYIERVFPNGHHFQQDNDPKHTSNYTKNYIADRNIHWWMMSTESQNLNPIENVWGSIKYLLRHQYKPMNIQDLETGINEIWLSMTPNVCRGYISHLCKVMPKVVQVEEAAPGYLSTFTTQNIYRRTNTVYK